MARSRNGRWIGGTLSIVLACAAPAAAAPSVEDALKLQPVQKDVEFDTPETAQMAKGSIKPEQEGKVSGWVVRDENGQVLRKFLDTDADNVVDQWSYFANGIEVYRDIDSNNNGKADQYRWLNSAGTRWAIDKDEDGRIDAWRAISAEEVTAEAVAAINTRDSARFARLLITEDELNQLGLGDEQRKSLAERAAGATDGFQKYLENAGKSAGALVGTGDLKWTHFGGSLPSTVPAGTAGSTKDLTIYDNVVAMVQSADKHDQIPIGTLVKVSEGWRLVDAPSTEMASSTAFMPRTTTSGGSSDSEGGDKVAQELMKRLQELDDLLQRSATPDEHTKLNAERAEIIQKLADAGTAEEYQLWMRQLADSVSAAVQSGTYPAGLALLKTKADMLATKGDKSLEAYFEFRLLTAEYGLKMRNPEGEGGFVKTQTWWLESLEKFVAEHPESSDAAEAMLQLGLAQEFAGQEDKAKEWYAKIAAKFGQEPIAIKAQGAVTRLDSVGKNIRFHGQTLNGQSVDLASLNGKPVVIHYWATWCEPCKAEFATLKELQAKYARDGLAIVGVSLDANKEDLQAFMQANKGISWPQLWSEGGLDSELANQLGVLTLPTMLLIDKDGRVANRSVHVSELDRAIGELLK